MIGVIFFLIDCLDKLSKLEFFLIYLLDKFTKNRRIYNKNKYNNTNIVKFINYFNFTLAYHLIDNNVNYIIVIQPRQDSIYLSHDADGIEMRCWNNSTNIDILNPIGFFAKLDKLMESSKISLDDDLKSKIINNCCIFKCQSENDIILPKYFINHIKKIRKKIIIFNLNKNNIYNFYYGIV